MYIVLSTFVGALTGRDFCVKRLFFEFYMKFLHAGPCWEGTFGFKRFSKCGNFYNPTGMCVRNTVVGAKTAEQKLTPIPNNERK